MSASATGRGTGALVLAGGASRRFGSDKTQAQLGQRALLARVIDAVGPLVENPLVVGPWAPPGVDQVLEPTRFEGPLVALSFGLQQPIADRVLVLAADHPMLVKDLLRLLLARFDQTSADVVVPVRNGRLEPLVACYRRPAAASAAAELVSHGERRLGALLERLPITRIEEPEWRHVDPSGASFRDVDEPSELRDLAAEIREVDAPGHATRSRLSAGG